MLVSSATYCKFSEEFVELKQTHAACEEKICVLKEQVFLAEREENMTRKELNIFDAKFQESEDNLVEEAKKTATHVVMRSHVETKLEFRRGEWGIQDVDEAVNIFNEAYPVVVIDPNGGDGGDVACFSQI